MTDNQISGRITLAKPARAQIEEKKSVFICSVTTVFDETDARRFIEGVKKEFYDARHNVFAYILDGGNIARFTDDGEPKGSAGIPVLNVLKMSGLDGVCAVVTRYFGGILLGTGGLVRAYSAACKAAVDAAGIAKMEVFSVCETECSYSDYQKLQSKISSIGAVEENSEFSDVVKFRLSCLAAKFSELEDMIIQTTGGKCLLKLLYTEERPSN